MKNTTNKKVQLEILKKFLVAVWENIKSNKDFEIWKLARDMNISCHAGITDCLVRCGLIIRRNGNATKKHSYELLFDSDPSDEMVNEIWACMKKRKQRCKEKRVKAEKGKGVPIYPEISKKTYFGLLTPFTDQELLDEIKLRGYTGTLKKEVLIEL